MKFGGSTRVLVSAFCLAVGTVACTTVIEESDAADAVKIKDVTEAERSDYVRRAQVWEKVDIRSRNLLAGPDAKGFKLNEEVSCIFAEPEKEEDLGGASSKFKCTLPSGEVVKVKYGTGEGPDDNGEIYSEVLGTRLLWALGFYADTMYPVRVTCNNCPQDPWDYYKSFKEGQSPTGTRKKIYYKHALIERKLAGSKIEATKDQGLDWGELKPSFGGLTKAHADGLKLFAAFIKHSDSKPSNQRLMCLESGVTKDGKCTKPIGMIQDNGANFGSGNWVFSVKQARAQYNEWDRSIVWKDLSKCQAELRDQIDGTMTDPKVSEEGRAFLAGLLAQLSDEQIRQLFVVSRVEERGQEMRDQLSGLVRKVTVEDWVKLFKYKRDQIVRPKCPT